MTHADFLSLYNTLKVLRYTVGTMRIHAHRPCTPVVAKEKPYDVITTVLALAR